MSFQDHTRKIAILGNYVPRQCGIATFTNDVYKSIRAAYPSCDCLVVPVNDRSQGYEYPPEVRFEIEEQDLQAYERAADFLNFNNVEVVCIQHEFGIYGGPAGSHVLALMRDLHMPIVTTLHTVLDKPNADQKRVMKELDRLSARLIVMTERSALMLTKIYGVSPSKIDIIAHGIPDMPFVDPTFFKDQFGVEGKKVLLTFGLLSPNKGIEHMIRALPKVVERHPDLVYIVLGATHPNLVRDHGESYRMSLERLITDLRIKKHVAFYNRFVELEELKEFLGAADIYITPYLNPAQAVSGTLSYAFGCGKPVISTPYWHAEELLANDHGVLVPFGDSDALAAAINTLMEDDGRRNTMRKKAYMLGREMIWQQSAFHYAESFMKARQTGVSTLTRRSAVKTMETERLALPDLKLDHLGVMTDSTGIFQHADFCLPNFHEGYCTDDNARALLLTVLMESTGDDTELTARWQTRYAAFLNHAWRPETRRFHNFMSFDRKWLDEAGSDDSFGRTIWALGTCVGRARARPLQMWAARLFEQAISMAEELTAPRSWAFCLFGIHEYLRRLSGDRHVNQVRDLLTFRLTDIYRRVATPDWKWFESSVTYDNAILPHVLILSGRWTNNQDAAEFGLESARWLTKIQTTKEGYFRPIGSDNFYKKDGPRAKFDQQPLEAMSTVQMCLEAYRTTRDESWYSEAQRAFVWFLGQNDVGQALYDPLSGGCHDGLHVDRVNQNCGAESTLSYLIALQEMRILENSLSSYEEPIEATIP